MQIMQALQGLVKERLEQQQLKDFTRHPLRLLSLVLLTLRWKEAAIHLTTRTLVSEFIVEQALEILC